MNDDNVVHDVTIDKYKHSMSKLEMRNLSLRQKNTKISSFCINKFKFCTQ